MVRRVLFLLREAVAKKKFLVREDIKRKAIMESIPPTATDDLDSDAGAPPSSVTPINDEEPVEDLPPKRPVSSAFKRSVSVSSQMNNNDDEKRGTIPSLQNILSKDQEDLDFSSSSPMPIMLTNGTITMASVKTDPKMWHGLKSTMLEAIDELLVDFENVHDPIAKQSIGYIHAREIVLVYGASRAVFAFLANAHHVVPSFEVFVAETGNGYRGHKMAMDLAKIGIDTTVITDSAIFGLMSRVNKVLIGAKAVMANGGVLSENGTDMVATAAKHHSVPLVCVTGLYKLCPFYPFNQDSFNDLVSPGSTLPFADVPTGDVEIVSPAFDYISPDKVALFVTDSGAHQPSYIYRLLAEYYSPDDDLNEGLEM